MDPDDSQDDSHDEENVEDDGGLIPTQMDEDFFSQITQKAIQIEKILRGSGEPDHATDIRRLQLVVQKLRKESLMGVQEMEDMKLEIENAKHKLTQALTISKVDQATISRLKEETEKAWKQTDAAYAREQQAQEQLYILRDKVEKLEDEKSKMVGKKEGADELSSSLTSHKHTILKERDRLAAEVEELNRRLQIQRLYTDEIERKRAEIEAKNKELYKVVDVASGEAYKEKRTIDVITDKLTLVSNERDTFINEAKNLKDQCEALIANNVQQNLQILALKTNLERAHTQLNNANSKIVKYQSEIEQCSEVREKIQQDLNQKTNLLKIKDDETTKLKSELLKIEKSRDILSRKTQNVEKTKHNLETELTKLRTVANAKSKEESILSKAASNTEKKLKVVTQERNTLQKEIPKIQRQNADTEEALILANYEIKSLKDDLKQKSLIEQRTKAAMSKMEIERDRNSELIQLLEDKIESMHEEIRLKEDYTVELKNRNNELNSSLVKMQGLFETARTERNNFERNLQACTEEKDDCKNRLNIANRKLEQNHETIRNKEAEILRTQKNLEKLEKDCQKGRLDFRNLEVILQSTRSELKEKRSENERLYKTLSENEIRLDKLRKQFETTLHDKDFVGSQLVRRNDEIALLKENMQVLQSAVSRGEKQYAERIEDIRLLKMEIQNLRSQRNILTRGMANTCDLRQEVLQLHRILNEERVKNRALQEEMMTPMNVHRWRALGGSDPERLSLIMKIHNLQKRILSQTVAASEREQALQETQNLYNTLKEFMLKLPSYKIKERLVETQHALQVRDKKIKALAAELNTKEIDEKSRDCIVDELRSNLETAKKDLIREKKTKQKLIKEYEVVGQMRSFSAPVPCVRTAGAGYKMTLNT